MPTRIEVWAQLWLCAADCCFIRELLVAEKLVRSKSIIPNMHLTVYHSRRPMPGLSPIDQAVRLIIPTAETRFMVLAPGGENPRPDINPARCKVGIRIQRKNEARAAIQSFRAPLLAHETPNVLGGRRPSTGQRNAFGARNFQPHVALLRSGNGIDRDLTKVGELFRRKLQHLTFDRFTIDIVAKDHLGRRLNGQRALDPGRERQHATTLQNLASNTLGSVLTTLRFIREPAQHPRTKS